MSPWRCRCRGLRPSVAPLVASCAVSLVDASCARNEPLSIPFDRAPHAERWDAFLCSRLEALETDQHPNAPTQASPSRPRDDNAVKRREATYKGRSAWKLLAAWMRGRAAG